MDASQTQKTSSFQNAIAAVEALSTEEQTLLIQIIQERLQQKQNKQVASDIKDTKGFQAYLASKQKRFEVYKNLADS
ncbi:hypothetical protein Xen7305DRAFT_00030240 [Xenococcus sp. PCC 7305]|uniref:hypothetical protein n=1 Tax=Xenococcus sp. PCC 7305 TaxID=102125 RepID=UPI0002ABBBED|nr:hypothetical protein [Xenococcus sp. PCC 7305]ELS03303.1 hypothetical protein Xen7305DRAFT_00030240 [Xenococcus sp. PCC 7305]